MAKKERRNYVCKCCNKPFSAVVGSELYEMVEFKDLGKIWPRCRQCMEKDPNFGKEGY